MNCKQGDLAIVVKSNAGNEGKIVTCLRLATEHDLREYKLFSDWASPVWLIDALIVNKTNGKNYPFVHDARLRPIRPSEGQDETLTWLDVQSTEGVAA